MSNNGRINCRHCDLRIYLDKEQDIYRHHGSNLIICYGGRITSADPKLADGPAEGTATSPAERAYEAAIANSKCAVEPAAPIVAPVERLCECCHREGRHWTNSTNGQKGCIDCNCSGFFAANSPQPAPVQPAEAREIILHDAAGLRPEMVKARISAMRNQSDADLFSFFMSEQPGLLKRIWDAKVAAETELAKLRSLSAQPAPLPKKSGFICAEWKQISEGPILDFATMRRRQVVYRCDLPDGHDGDHVDQVLLVNWKDEPAPLPVVEP